MNAKVHDANYFRETRNKPAGSAAGKRPLDPTEMRPDGFYGSVMHRHTTNTELRRRAVAKKPHRSASGATVEDRSRRLGRRDGFRRQL